MKRTMLKAVLSVLLSLSMLVAMLPTNILASSNDVNSQDKKQSETVAYSVKQGQFANGENQITPSMANPTYNPSPYYAGSIYYERLCNVALTGDQRTDIVNVALSQVGYHEGDCLIELDGSNGTGSDNYSEAGYWFGTQVKGNSYGHYYAWCAMFVSWCARQAGIPTYVISNAAYAMPDGASSSGGYSYFHVNYHAPENYSPQTADLIFFCWDGDDSNWDHVGFVYEVDEDSVTTIEGNGDNQVIVRTYDKNDQRIRAYGVPNYTHRTTTTSTDDIIQAKINYLYDTLGGTYFTVDHSTGCGLKESGHSCSNCLVSSILSKGWFTSIFGNGISTTNFPTVYYYNGSFAKNGWSCFGFAQFAMWYIFAGSNTDEVSAYKVGNYGFNYNNMSTYAHIGDQIRLANSTSGSGNHSVIFISADSDGINVLDSNWGGTYNCLVQKHKIAYSKYSYATISRSSDIPVNNTPTDPTYEIEEGNWTYTVTGSLGVNVRSGPGTSYGVLTAIPKGSQITVTGKSSNWGRVTYNGTTGWVCLDYCMFVNNEVDPGNSQQGTWTYVVTGSLGVNVRSGPGTGYDVLTAIPKGTTITITEKNNNWGKTTYNGITGWVSLEYCEEISGSTPDPDTQITWTYQVTGDEGLNVRSGPGIDYSKLTAIPRWTMITITEIQGNWGKTTYNGITGWVCLDYAQLISVNRPSYTVRFINYDGTVLKSESVEYGYSATPPSNPSRVGYTFVGWSGSYTNVTANSDVYAQFSINIFTVQFLDWNGTVLSTQQVYYGDAAVAPANPTRIGYTFTGWNKGFSSITANETITAQYQINSYEVVFADWDDSIISQQTVQHGGSATAPSNPTRVGYEFTGWDTPYANITAPIIIRALYAINSYTVTYYIDGEQYGTQTVEYGAQIEPPQVDVEGYTFSGWMLSDGSALPEVMPAHDLDVFGMLARNYVTVTYTGAYIGTAQVPFGGNAVLPVLDAVGVHYTFTVNGEPWDGVALTGDVTVEVGMDINVYTVAFVDPVDGQTLSVQSVTHGQNASAPAAPQHYGYTFGGWDTEFTNVQSDLTVMAIFDPVEYTVVFMDGCDNVIEVQSVPYLSAATAPADPVREGYTFTGWDLDFSCVEHAMVINATWSRNYYTVTFVGVYTGTVIVEHGVDCELPVYDSASVHYTFTVNGEPWDGKNITCDVTVTVGVAINGVYTVTFVDWDGTVIDTQQVAYGAAASAPADPSREGWTFAGWDKDFSYITADTVVTALYVENPTPEVKPGDVNGDGLITATDISVLFAYVMNAGSISDSAMIAADINGDGEVNATDASLLAQMVFGA